MMRHNFLALLHPELYTRMKCNMFLQHINIVKQHTEEKLRINCSMLGLKFIQYFFISVSVI